MGERTNMVLKKHILLGIELIISIQYCPDLVLSDLVDCRDVEQLVMATDKLRKIGTTLYYVNSKHN